jgi:hypothetical protein
VVSHNPGRLTWVQPPGSIAVTNSGEIWLNTLPQTVNQFTEASGPVVLIWILTFHGRASVPENTQRPLHRLLKRRKLLNQWQPPRQNPMFG